MGVLLYSVGCLCYSMDGPFLLLNPKFWLYIYIYSYWPKLGETPIYSDSIVDVFLLAKQTKEGRDSGTEFRRHGDIGMSEQRWLAGTLAQGDIGVSGRRCGCDIHAEFDSWGFFCWELWQKKCRYQYLSSPPLPRE